MPRSLRTVMLCTAAGILLGPAHAPAAIDSFALSPEQLFGATVMSVSKTSEKLMDAPAAIYVLTGEDIQRSGATSIAEALRMVPGVQVARSHASGWAVSVRGFNSGLANKLLVLIDGREVYDQLFSGVYWELQDTALEDIERIEVIRGPGASRWGANAVNGVINIITRHARDTKGGLVSAIAGNQERDIFTGRFGGETGEGIHYRAYAKHTYRDEESRLNGFGAQDHQKALRAGFRSDWERNAGRDSFTLQGDALSNESAQLRVSPVSVLTHERISSKGWNVLGRWSRALEGGAQLTVQGYLDYTYRDQLLLADQRMSYDIEAQYEFTPLGRHKLIAGGRYRLSDDELSETTFINAGRRTRKDQLFSGFVQDKITLAPEAWYLTLGSKLEHNDYSGVEVQPSARLQWHINKEKMAWASVSRAVRTPSQLEQDLTIEFLRIIGIPFFGELPNPHFRSEELVAYEMGYRQQITSFLSLDAAAFYNDYDGISAISTLPGGPFLINVIAINGTQAEAYGGELVLDWRARENLRFSATYSYLQMQLHGPAGAINAEVAEGQSPHHQFNARAAWDIREDLAFDTALYFTESLPDFQVKHYWRLDLGLGWKISESLQFHLQGQNLLRGEHHEFVAVDDPFTPPATIGRSIYGKLTWAF